MFPVIEELSKHPTEMTDPTEIAQYMRDFHGGFLSTARANPAYTPVRTLLDQVGWLVSSVEGGRVQLRMYHSTHEFEPMWYEEGVPGSLLPIDMTAEQSLPTALTPRRCSTPACSRRRPHAGSQHQGHCPLLRQTKPSQQGGASQIGGRVSVDWPPVLQLLEPVDNDGD